MHKIEQVTKMVDLESNSAYLYGNGKIIVYETISMDT